MSWRKRWHRWVLASAEPAFVGKVTAMIVGVGIAMALLVGMGVQSEDGMRNLLEHTLAKQPPQVEPNTTVEGEWETVSQVVAVWKVALMRPHGAVVVLGVAAVWFIVILRVAAVPWARAWRGVVGLAAGLGAILVTLWLGTVLERLSPLAPNGEPLHDFIFYLTRVALVEELAKVGCFLCLWPLVRKGTTAEAFFVASCTGLGFAAEENLRYVVGLTPVLTRFFSANIVHFVCTGCLGAAVFCAIHWPRQFLHKALAMLLAALVAHGLWNVVSSLRMDAPGASGSDVQYILLLAVSLLVLFWLREGGQYRVQVAKGIPAWALLIYGASALFSAQLVWGASLVGFYAAFTEQMKAAVGLTTICLIIMWHLRRHA